MAQYFMRQFNSIVILTNVHWFRVSDLSSRWLGQEKKKENSQKGKKFKKMVMGLPRLGVYS